MKINIPSKAGTVNKKLYVKFSGHKTEIPTNYEENYSLWKSKKITIMQAAKNCNMSIWEFYKCGLDSAEQPL